jgi:hypothetical protein
MAETAEQLPHLLSHPVEHDEARLESFRVWAGRAQAAGLVHEGVGRVVAAAEETGRALQGAAQVLARKR